MIIADKTPEIKVAHAIPTAPKYKIIGILRIILSNMAPKDKIEINKDFLAKLIALAFQKNKTHLELIKSK